MIQGGLRILDKLARLQHGSLVERPRLRAWDAVPMLWHAARMRTTADTAAQAAT